MKLKVQGKKSEKVEYKKKMSGKDKTGNTVLFRSIKKQRSERRQQLFLLQTANY